MGEREGGRERGREGGKEGGREGGREEGREGGREGGREDLHFNLVPQEYYTYMTFWSLQLYVSAIDYSADNQHT